MYFRHMPTYRYKCESCGHEFEAEQRISDPPLTNCTMIDARLAERSQAFKDSVGVFSWQEGKSADGHPHRCSCQADDSAPHKHGEDDPHACYRCSCSAYTPAEPRCSGKVTRLISSTSFVLKGPGWFKDGY